ncbi:MAG: DNA polymerase I [Candidatus Marinimicrobia bacterium]|nr:DNA polymerase I [Candidatus Neomarinimicrobiota bacterium]
MKKLFLIDGMALIFRAFYAFINNPLYTKKGFPTSAIYGFFNSIIKILNEESPDYIAITMDSKKPTFRHNMYSAYKANRVKMPDDLSIQIKEIIRMIERSNMNILMKDGYEADDVIATITKYIKSEKLETYIVTGDKDIMQLVCKNVFVYNPGNKYSGPVIYDEANVQKKWNVTPEKICDLLSLMGDSSDNIPGVSGIGPKTAAKLINQFGSVASIIENSDNILNDRIKGMIKNQVQTIELSNKLVSLDRDVPINIDLNKMWTKDIVWKNISQDFIDFEMPSMIDSINKKLNINFEEPSLKKLENSNKQYISILNLKDLKKLKKNIVKHDVVSFSLETTSTNPLDAEIIGISFSFYKNQAFYIPLIFNGKLEGYDLSKNLIINQLKDVFEDPQKMFVGHNMKYNCLVLSALDVKVHNIYFDTMIAAHLLNPTKNSYNLDELSLKYLDYQKINIEDILGYKGNQICISEVDLQILKNYTCENVDVTFKLYYLLKDKLKQNSLWDLFKNIEIPFINVLVIIEQNGLFVDLEVLKLISDKICANIDLLLDKIYNHSGRNFNVNSPQQLAQVLFDELGLKEVRKRSTAVEVLEVLKKVHPLPESILDYRHLNKLKTTYLDGIPKFLNANTNRVHTSFNQTVASTGRLSSTKPNFQNIPIKTAIGKEIRKAFKPQRKKWMLISADYSQIELRVMAHFSKEPALLDAFRKNEDVHSRTASLVHNVKVSSVTPDQRRQAKIVNYGIMYGAGPFRMCKELNISMVSAKKLIDQYFKTYPNIRLFIDNTIQKAKKDGYISTLFGRKRDTSNLNALNNNVVNSEKRATINMPIQGTASEMIKIAMININNLIVSNKLKSNMVLQVHDELIFELPLDEERVMTEIIVSQMEDSVKLDVPIKVDCKSGYSWYDIH